MVPASWALTIAGLKSEDIVETSDFSMVQAFPIAVISWALTADCKVPISLLYVPRSARNAALLGGCELPLRARKKTDAPAMTSSTASKATRRLRVDVSRSGDAAAGLACGGCGAGMNGLGDPAGVSLTSGLGRGVAESGGGIGEGGGSGERRSAPQAPQNVPTGGAATPQLGQYW